jgi:hypothetical protein
MQNIEAGQVPTVEVTAPEASPEPVEEPEWMSAVKEEQPVPQETPKPATGGLPSWLNDLDKEEPETLAPPAAVAPAGDLPAWLRDETGEVVAEPTRIEPTRPADWKPVETKQPEPEPVAPTLQPVPVQATEPPKKPAPPARPPKEPAIRRAPEVSSSLDPVLGLARNELSRSNIPGALESYGRLIKKGRFLEEAIYDLREALYRYPVEVSIWQTLGDAYMRANRLQDALDAYTKAEELLR